VLKAALCITSDHVIIHLST